MRGSNVEPNFPSLPPVVLRCGMSNILVFISETHSNSATLAYRQTKAPKSTHQDSSAPRDTHVMGILQGHVEMENDGGCGGSKWKQAKENRRLIKLIIFPSPSLDTHSNGLGFYGQEGSRHPHPTRSPPLCPLPNSICTPSSPVLLQQ